MLQGLQYELQSSKHFLNDVTMWRAHIPALINMNIIKSSFLHQCRLNANGNDFKVVQKGFINSSSNIQETYHLGFTCKHSPFYLMKPISNFFYFPLQIVSIGWIPLNWWSNTLAWNLWTWKTFTVAIHTS